MTNAVFITILSICFSLNIFGLPSGLCPAGFSCSDPIHQVRNNINNSPVPCPAGTFSVLGQHDCSPCAPGYFANKTGSAFCEACPAGSMCNASGRNPVPCAKGTFASCIRQTCCAVCPLGTYTMDVGSSECIKCPIGASCRQVSAPACDQDGHLSGSILTFEYQKILTQFTGKYNARWKLIYKATRDGFRATDFHYHCNDQSDTISIIQSKNGYIFGGYASLPWNSANAFIKDTKAFIFTLKNPHSFLPTRYMLKSGSEPNALYGGANYGPTFGGGHDIHVPDKSNETNGYTNFGSSYSDTTGKGQTTFSGNYNFQVSDIEVYKLYA